MSRAASNNGPEELPRKAAALGSRRTFGDKSPEWLSDFAAAAPSQLSRTGCRTTVLNLLRPVTTAPTLCSSCQFLEVLSATAVHFSNFGKRTQCLGVDVASKTYSDKQDQVTHRVDGVSATSMVSQAFDVGPYRIGISVAETHKVGIGNCSPDISNPSLRTRSVCEVSGEARPLDGAREAKTWVDSSRRIVEISAVRDDATAGVVEP